MVRRKNTTTKKYGGLIMKKLLLLTALNCTLPALATETAQEKTQRRLHVISNHIFPQKQKATFACAQQEPSTISCIDCQTGETQSWQTQNTYNPFIVPARRSFNKVGSKFPQGICIEGCAAQTIDLTKLPQPSQTASYIARLGEKAINDQCKILGLQQTITDKAELIKAVAQKEHELAKTHYVFYHGTPKHVLVGLLFNTELARAFENWQEGNFIKLRASQHFYTGKDTLLEYLRNNLGKINDMKSPYQEHLLSTNLSFPGFMDHTGSSTFRYFLENHSASNMNNFLEKTGILASLPNIDPDIQQKLCALIAQQTEKLSELANKLSDTGILIQIFIPKTIVNECAYLAEALGGTQRWKMSTPTIGKWDPDLHGHTDIADALENYQNGCTAFNEKDLYRMQARLRLDKDKFDNPQSGIKFFVYHELPQQEFAQLKTDIQTLVKDFVANKEVQFLLQVYEECNQNPADPDTLHYSITATEAAYSNKKANILQLIQPEKALAQFCIRHGNQFDIQQSALIKNIITRYPTLAQTYTTHCKQSQIFNHQIDVYSVAFSPDGKLLATCSADSTACLWDTTTGTKLHTFKHNHSVYKVAFSPDGKLLATGSYDNTTCLWDITTGTKLHTFNHKMFLNSIAFSPDGTRLAICSTDKTTYLWDTATGNKIHTFNHQTTVHSVAFSPNGKLLATCSGGNTAYLWDTATGNKIHTFNHQNNIYDVYSVAFSPNGKLLATCSADSTTCVWDTTTGTKLHTFKHNNSVFQAVFSPDGTRLATRSGGNTAYLWDTTTGIKLHTFNHQNNVYDVYSVAFSPNGKLLATGSSNATACLWDTATGKKIHTFHHKATVYSVAFSPDGKRLAIAGSCSAYIWDITAQTLGEFIEQKEQALMKNVTQHHALDNKESLA